MTPPSKNYLGIGLAGLAIITFWVLLMPLWDNLSLLKSSVAEKEKVFAEREDILKEIDKVNKQYQSRSVDVTKISSVIPNKKSPAELVSSIEIIAQQSGLQLVEITMGGTKKEDKELQTASIELGLTGSYGSFTTFLGLLEKNIRLLDVFEISISQAAIPGGQVVLNFRAKINAYYLTVK
ncbi:MAG: type 4a pilus biogenesis protein PilO [Candidatus Colwellbacteria bacterium]|nr:type 4a pilus biogenesis protein PilO [Candidatus Colwellbacteria bacterium]